MAPREERKQASTGSRLIMIGAPFVVIGIVLSLLLNANRVGIGVAIAILGALPVVAGVALLLSAGTQRRVRKGKPFV